MEGCEELSHDGDDCLEGCLSPLDKVIGEGLESRVVASGGHCGHEESVSQEAVAGL